MKVLIIEDERFAAERLQMMLNEYDCSVEISGCIDSIEDTCNWLQKNNHPDLMLLDIHLADGFCFEIFKKVKYSNPVIFTTAYNDYAIESFKYFSIDYLLKPVTYDALKSALDKYKMITSRFATPDYETMFEVLKSYAPKQYKERFLARIGQRLVFIKTSEITYFKADDKIVCLADNQGNKFPVDYTMDKLEQVLNPKIFFRLNRKVIVSIDCIAQIKPYTNSRLLLYLKDGIKTEEVIIARERVTEFRKWADQ